jgi:hypothetical protein
MNRIDLIIENIEYSKLVTVQAHKDELLEEALAAARELRELKPVAWVGRRITSEGRVLDGFLTCDSDEYGAIPVYILDEVTK